MAAMKHIANTAIGLALFFTLAGIPAGAQNTTSSQSVGSSGSLGDYARQVRKTPETGGKAKVFDNDNLPKTDKLSVVGKVAVAPAAEKSGEAKSEEAANASTSEARTEAKAGTDAKAPAPDAEKKAPEDAANREAAMKQWSDKINAQKQQVDLLGRELDVVQREYQIRAAAMYADAGNRLRNSSDWDKQDAQYKQQIADKQKALEDAKIKLNDIQDQASRAGVPSSITEQ